MAEGFVFLLELIAGVAGYTFSEMDSARDDEAHRESTLVRPTQDADLRALTSLELELLLLVSGLVDPKEDAT